MDYEKMYKAVLKTATQWIKDGCSDKDKICLESIFPELRESEDERIRKLLVWQVYRNIEDETNDLAGSVYDGIKGHDPDLEESIEDWKKCLAYLEKQKSKMIQWTGKNLKEVIYFTGKSPRFDEWFKSWEDFENYVHSHGDILKLFCEDGSHYEVPVGAWIVKTPDGFNIPSLFKFVQKSTEWNGEDEEMLRIIINRVEKFNEWATEQGYPIDDPTMKQSPIDWLKALHPSWKPSEEQMGALEKTIRLANFGLKEDRRKALVSLYEQLKKL